MPRGEIEFLANCTVRTPSSEVRGSLQVIVGVSKTWTTPKFSKKPRLSKRQLKPLRKKFKKARLSSLQTLAMFADSH